MIEATLTEEFSGLVNHLVDRLRTEPGEKQKIFKNTLLTNFDEWVGLFESRNLTKNQELSDQVVKAKTILRSVSPDALRNNTELRGSIQKSFLEIKATTDQFVTTKPSRMMDLD